MNRIYGHDFSEASPETARVVRAVLPVFTLGDRPERLGSCVLVRTEGQALVVTAAHVINESEHSKQFRVAQGGQLITINGDLFLTRSDDPADIGLIPLDARASAHFEARGGMFLAEQDIDETEPGDGTDVQNAFANTYFALGFPASRSRSRIQRHQRMIHLESYSVRLTLAPTRSYPDGLSDETHLLLDYDERSILLDGENVNPPQAKGMSGGGIFRFRRKQPDTTKLVGILIEQHKRVHVLAGTKIAVALSLAREITDGVPIGNRRTAVFGE